MDVVAARHKFPHTDFPQLREPKYEFNADDGCEGHVECRWIEKERDRWIYLIYFSFRTGDDALKSVIPF